MQVESTKSSFPTFQLFGAKGLEKRDCVRMVSKHDIWVYFERCNVQYFGSWSVSDLLEHCQFQHDRLVSGIHGVKHDGMGWDAIRCDENHGWKYRCYCIDMNKLAFPDPVGAIKTRIKLDCVTMSHGDALTTNDQICVRMIDLDMISQDCRQSQAVRVSKGRGRWGYLFEALRLHCIKVVKVKDLLMFHSYIYTRAPWVREGRRREREREVRLERLGICLKQVLRSSLTDLGGSLP